MRPEREEPGPIGRTALLPAAAQRTYDGRRPRQWDFTILRPSAHPYKEKEKFMSRTPLVILIGADKGGVGKTTVARIAADYMQARGATARTYDTELGRGDLVRFAPTANVVDIATTRGQMAIFDTLEGVTLVDIRAGEFSKTLRALDEAKLLDDVRSGALNLVLLHVLGPTDRSFGEVGETAAIIGGSTRHFVVKNFINEGDFDELEKDGRFASQMRQMAQKTVVVPHLTADACDALQKLGVSFDAFARDSSQSRMLRGPSSPRMVRARCSESGPLP
jgi:hypothetical protein